MKTMLILGTIMLLSGCSVLSAVGAAFGVGATDIAPSLKYCHHVEYKRVGIDMEVRAECRVPAGG